MADLNTNNPLVLRTVNGKLNYNQHDDNFRNLMRGAGLWDVARVPYQKNEVVYWEGGLWIAQFPTSAQPVVGSPAWAPMTLNNGIGAMELGSPILLPGDIDATYENLDAYDQVSVTPVGATLDPINGYFSFSYPGVWEISLMYFASVTETQGGRTYSFRVFDVTTATPGRVVPVALGRNTSGINLTVPFFVRITEPDLGDNFVFQIGDASATILVESLDLLAMSMKQVAV